ncbi:hypothetical protein [Helicobacter marmotae]|uniref:hypothetical protein n=1 Tax=Helicobacter marmotae TaxID=152490 RepID=UPI0011C07FA6|nr:hypothetical protein [Helicobacter marmotae]
MILAEILRSLPLPQNDNSGRVSSNSNRDSSPAMQAQNDNKSNLQDKITLQRKLVCHSKHCEETSPELPATPLFCHVSRAGKAQPKNLYLSH